MNPGAAWQFSLDSVHALIWGVLLLIALIACVRSGRPAPLVYATLAMTLLLVMLGAYVRLSDAGLGCPDWPGCYGKISPSHAAEQIAAAEAAAPAGPVSPHKAWREMLHRYLASVVGVMILAIAIQTFLARRDRGPTTDDPSRLTGLPLLLVGLVAIQGLLGKWTVTLLLRPAVVTLHLLGGMALVAALSWLAARHLGLQGGQPSLLRGVRPWVLVAAVLLAIQIALGGWVSTNYAALVCADFPTCQGVWLPDTDFAAGFHVLRDLGQTADGNPLPGEALNAIHWLHRVGALVTVVVIVNMCVRISRVRVLRPLGGVILLLLGCQIVLGITNVVASLPLAVAVAHNGVAALLLAAVTMLNFAVRSPSMVSR